LYVVTPFLNPNHLLISLNHLTFSLQNLFYILFYFCFKRQNLITSSYAHLNFKYISFINTRLLNTSSFWKTEILFSQNLLPFSLSRVKHEPTSEAPILKKCCRIVSDTHPIRIRSRYVPIRVSGEYRLNYYF
jgi:hypothetical protein